MSGKVQNANTHRLRGPKTRASAQQLVNSWVSSMGRWSACQGRLKMQTLTDCGAKITSTRTTAGQVKGQFSGAMERYTVGLIRGKAHPLPQTHMATVSITVGRRKTCQGRFKMQTLTCCDAKITSTHTAAGQLLSSRVSSRGQWNVTHGFNSRQSSPPARTHMEQLSVFQWGDGGNI